MGYIKNHAILVTGTYGDAIDQAHKRALECFGGMVSPIIESRCNGTRSFFIPPDGSKEGWAASFRGDQQREQFKIWLRAQLFEDKSAPLDWVEVTYGGDDQEAAIVDDGDVDWRREEGSAR